MENSIRSPDRISHEEIIQNSTMRFILVAKNIKKKKKKKNALGTIVILFFPRHYYVLSQILLKRTKKYLDFDNNYKLIIGRNIICVTRT